MATPTKYPNLLSSLKMGDLTLPNRVAMAPMTRGRADDHYIPTPMMATYYAQRASSGLIITEGTHVSLTGRGWFQAPEIYTDAHVDAWRPVTEAVHAKNGRIFCQLWHTGRASHSSFREGLDGYADVEAAKGVAPSAVKRGSSKGTQGFTPKPGEVEIETPRALTLDEIKALPDEFRNAAQKAKDAGFDGVELHCANGYLLDEFLQSCSNTRTDEYGGSFENRFRIVSEVLNAIFTVFDSTRVAVRLSPNGNFNGMGSVDNHEAFLYYVKRISELNLGYLHMMVGLGFGFHGHGEAMTMAEVREVYGNGVLMANVGYTAETGEKEIASGATDLISFGRPYLANPDLVERFATGATLAEGKGMETWYSTVEYKPAEVGYIDYGTMA